MKRQVNMLLALAGAAVLLGCTQDPVGKAPGGLEPSASSQRSDDRGSDSGSASSGRGSESGGSGNGDADGDSGGST
jgi:hypothetical protein